jgi:connector enhancer of kinase suppressor of Ras 2
MLKLGLELATVAQRDRFSYNPIENLSKLTSKLSSLSNYIIQDITDPLLLQPAYLDLVTLKKNKSELGFSIMQSYQYVHRISEIKFNSPAHNSGRVEDNDEIIQVNYQTVIGWPYSKVILQFEESTTDVLLTLKRRPKHTKIYGLLGMIKLPSKKRPSPFRWDNVLPSPRFDFEPDSFPLINKTTFKEIDMEESSGNESDTTMTPTEIKSSHKELRMYMPKPRASVLQRRYTICGDDLKSFQNIGSHKILHDLHVDQENLDSPSLRDKSVSFGFGLELTPRPTTCLGLPTSKAAKGSLPSMFQKGKTTDAIEECDEKSEVNSITTGASKVVRFDSTNNNTSNEYNQDSQYICNVENTIIESSVPIPYADEDDSIKEEIVVPKVRKMEPPKPAPRTFIEKKSSNGHQYVEAVNVIVVNREAVKRGRLDKSHSTPTYNDDESGKILNFYITIKIFMQIYFCL